MSWTTFFVENLPNAKTVASEDGRPFVSMEVEPRGYVQIHLTTSETELPFKIVFKSFDSIGGILEDREYGSAGTKHLALKLAFEMANFRLNSREFILDGE